MTSHRCALDGYRATIDCYTTLHVRHPQLFNAKTALSALLPPMQACHWAIDELKATVPIWKKVCCAPPCCALPCCPVVSCCSRSRSMHRAVLWVP